MRGRMRKLAVLLALAAVPLSLWVALPLPSSGSSSGEIQRKIDRKETRIAGHRAHERVLTSDITAFTRQINSLQGDINRLQVRQTRLEFDLAAKRALLARVQAQLRAE